MSEKINLDVVPDPYRELAFAMHAHGHVQGEDSIWASLDITPNCPVSYTEDHKAQLRGWIRGLDFRIKEILYDLETAR